MDIGEILKSVVQRGEAPKFDKKLLTNTPLGAIITELSHKRQAKINKVFRTVAKTSLEKNLKKFSKPP